MNAMILLLASATVGVDVGWQPLAGGGFEYIIQIEPETLESLKAGNDIISEIPPELVGVRRYRITIGTGPVPRIGTPPEVALGQFRPADHANATNQNPAANDPFAANGASAGQESAATDQSAAVHDPFATGSSTAQAANSDPTANGHVAGSQTNDRYAGATTGTDPFASSRNGAGVSNEANGDASPTTSGSASDAGSAGSLLDRVRGQLQGDGNATPLDSQTDPTREVGAQSGSSAGTVPQMGENPFRQPDRYATNPRYDEAGSQFSAGSGAADPFSAVDTTNTVAPDQESVAGNDLPPGEYILPLPPKTDFSQHSSTTNNRYGDRYGDLYGSGAANSAATGANDSTPANNYRQEGNHGGDVPTDDQDRSAPNTSADPFNRSRFSDNTNSSAYDETPPPALNPDDNATRLANYRSDEEGPSGKSKKSGTKSATGDESQPGWMWTILVLAMFASAGANGWLALLLRDTRRKYADLLERYQDGEDEEYDEEEGVHYEAA